VQKLSLKAADWKDVFVEVWHFKQIILSVFSDERLKLPKFRQKATLLSKAKIHP
jgi:hypothetical protein